MAYSFENFGGFYRYPEGVGLRDHIRAWFNEIKFAPNYYAKRAKFERLVEYVGRLVS